MCILRVTDCLQFCFLLFIAIALKKSLRKKLNITHFYAQRWRENCSSTSHTHSLTYTNANLSLHRRLSLLQLVVSSMCHMKSIRCRLPLLVYWTFLKRMKKKIVNSRGKRKCCVALCCVCVYVCRVCVCLCETNHSAAETGPPADNRPSTA